MTKNVETFHSTERLYIGVLIFFLAVQLIFGAKIPWLAQKMLNHPIKLETVQKFLKAGISSISIIVAVIWGGSSLLNLVNNWLNL
ncbi:MAG TPA: exopolysaccharide biosynthesis protein [Nodularia sp. (in: cyanobacteria)]|nr:exopolysaccharide biosynthesis protein [Nodularia sp. (in: cyanobacteria)]